MNYNALLLLDKHHNHKISISSNVLNMNQFSFFNNKNNYNINVHIKDNQKYKKFYSVKPSLYIIPKDIILKDIFNYSLKTTNEFSHLYSNNNICDKDRKYIFDKIKKFILINHINYNIFEKTIFLYDLLCLQKNKIEENNENISKKFKNLNNILIGFISFLLVLKFNKDENKMISLKKLMKYFNEENVNDININEICEMEIIALQLIDYNLSFQTPFSFIELFLINGIIFNEDYINSDLSFNIYELVNETLENIMETSNEYFKYNYFYLCCCVIMYVREKFKINGWPKALEITFGVKIENFYDIYNILFIKKNNKNIIKNFYNADIINIGNLKSMSNIISVLKIMKSADKYRKTKDKLNNKLDIFYNDNDNENKEEEYKENNSNMNPTNKIKVGLKKKWNLAKFKSPGKLMVNKTSISSILIKLNEENKSMISNLYNKNIENKKNDINDNNKNDIKGEKEKINEEEKEEKEKEVKEKDEKEKEKENNDNKDIGMELTKKNSFNIIDKYKLNYTKSCNRYKKNINNNIENKSNNKINNENNNDLKIDNQYNKNTVNINIYQKRNYMNKKSNNLLKSYQDRKIENNNNNNLENSNINLKNNKNNNFSNKINYRYYSNYTEKKKNIELNNNSRKKNKYNLNQTSFNDFLFYKNKKNRINEENFDKIKNKEENSNVPTCESSNIKLSLNDFSIRKSYRLKKKYTKNEVSNLSPKNENKYEKDKKKILEKNKSYNKLLNTKISFSDNTYNRKTGVRKFYKQKNLLENH